MGDEALNKGPGSAGGGLNVASMAATPLRLGPIESGQSLLFVHLISKYSPATFR